MPWWALIKETKPNHFKTQNVVFKIWAEKSQCNIAVEIFLR